MTKHHHYLAPPSSRVANFAFLAATGGGLLTVVFHVILRIETLLAGILSAFSIYAFNLLLLHPTLPYGMAETLLSPSERLDRALEWGNLAWHPFSILYIFAVAILVKLALDSFYASEVGDLAPENESKLSQRRKKGRSMEYL